MRGDLLYAIIVIAVFIVVLAAAWAVDKLSSLRDGRRSGSDPGEER